MSDEKAIYWLTQIIGWFLFALLILFQNILLGSADLRIIGFLMVNFVVGIGLSHLMRHFIISWGMLRQRPFKILPGVLLLSAATAILSSVIIALISDLFFDRLNPILVPPFDLLLELFLPFTTVFVIWNILYFASIYLKNYEREEVKNLRLTSAMNEVELANLRSQLNPHFLFNALNSIRALVDENPKQAKTAITQMSNILRSSLSSGKRSFVTLAEEMRVVYDYLHLEKIRYEDRLECVFQIPEEVLTLQIPPMLIQTLVENAVKHGISKLPEGGVLSIAAMEREPGLIRIEVCNTGLYNPIGARQEAGFGIGLANSRRRLNLLYGAEAAIEIYNGERTVVCAVTFPTKPLTQTNDENTPD